MNRAPKYLYKILSKENWQKSQLLPFVYLSEMDKEFIHFSTEEQLDKIIQNFWSDVLEFVVLKIDTQKLIGNLVFESNPGGVNKYYHLYSGSIPIDAILEFKILK
ncbi:MAG: DUF952 domain-containing protein [Chlamydiae bacterium]|nr:DUF952 domain-containing protein [Chlamydiota bacterium]